jgi:hypothetical protein
MMTIRLQRTLTLGASYAAILLFVGTAMGADQTLLPVNTCQITANSSNSGFNTYGAAYTLSTFGSSVTCGIGQDNLLDTNDDLNIYFDDNNAESGANFVCYAYEVDEDWSSVVYVGQKYGCSTAGGCATDPGVYAAESYINLADAQHGGAYSVALTCLIPKNGANGTSLLKSIVLDEQ